MNPNYVIDVEKFIDSLNYTQLVLLCRVLKWNIADDNYLKFLLDSANLKKKNLRVKR